MSRPPSTVTFHNPPSTVHRVLSTTLQLPLSTAALTDDFVASLTSAPATCVRVCIASGDRWPRSRAQAGTVIRGTRRTGGLMGHEGGGGGL